MDSTHIVGSCIRICDHVEKSRDVLKKIKLVWMIMNKLEILYDLESIVRPLTFEKQAKVQSYEIRATKYSDFKN